MSELETLIRARYPLIYLVTPEEERALATLGALAEQMGRDLHRWSCVQGWGDAGTRDPLSALEYVRLASGRGIYVLCDLHPFFSNATVVRKLRELAQALKQTPKSLLVLGAVVNLPAELVSDVVIVDFELPDASLIQEMVGQAAHLAGRPLKLDHLEMERLLGAARGLTAGEFANGLARALVRHGALDARVISVIIEEKRQVVRKTGLLEFVQPEGALDEVGGLSLLKEWLRKRGRAFGRPARDFGLPEPRGLLLVGAPGCGKSLVAKCVAAQWGLPLLRLDVGRLLAGLVGASEENTRRALKMAEGLSPAVLWVDEIEKGFGATGGDGGTASRVLGTFLTWLQEKSAPVFVVATANQIQWLPPELLRKGRFDEIFFVDLPDAEERREILRLHLARRHRTVDEDALLRLAKLTSGYSGAELEQGVIDALYEAYDAARPVTPADLERGLTTIVPLSRHSEELQPIRTWAARHARPASVALGLPGPSIWAIEGPLGD
ncbi:MAG: AAA family ATPase [Candidatus Sericytochromatia bacterium]|nr:AAA family ATPase [Candidatus Sericytochromatia bacterium]